MRGVVVRYSTKAARSDENARLIENVFAELAATAPDGLHYMSVRAADGTSFVHIALVDTPDGTNPLTSSPAFAEFQRAIADRVDEGPVVTEVTVVGSYGFGLVPDAGSQRGADRGRG
jgi:hypothetical protein